MHYLKPLLAVAVLSQALLAQNEIELWPGVTNFTSRGSVGNNASGGEILQGLNTTVFTGIGDNGAFSRLEGFGMILQDQNTDTQEEYSIVFRSGTDAAGPGRWNVHLRGSFGPFTSPPRGTGGPIQAFNVTQSWGTARCLDLCEFNAFGVKLTQPPNPWAGDGLSCHMSRGDGAFAQSVQNASSDAPDMAWQIIDSGSGPVVTNPSLKRSWRFRLQTNTATLQLGNTGSAYGQGGPYPDMGADLSIRARYGSSSTADTSWLFLTDRRLCPGLRIQPGMRVYVNPFFLIGPFVATPNGSGEAVHALGTAPTKKFGLAIHFQAAGIDSKTKKGTLTNLATLNLE